MLLYNYHDALLEKIRFVNSRDIALDFCLYAIYYPELPKVSIIFEGIFNVESVKKYFMRALSMSDVDDEVIARCDVLRIDSKKTSSANGLYIFLALDGIGYIRIHCEQYREI